MTDRSITRQKTAGDRLIVTSNRPLKWFYLGLGTLSVGLGFLGIFLPLLPTTAFLLLAAWCYARSSRRFYDWLLGNRLFGKYITSYLEGKGVPLRTKIWSVLLLWITILGSAIFFIETLILDIILILIAIGVSIHIITLPNFKPASTAAIASEKESASVPGEYS